MRSQEQADNQFLREFIVVSAKIELDALGIAGEEIGKEILQLLIKGTERLEFTAWYFQHALKVLLAPEYPRNKSFERHTELPPITAHISPNPDEEWEEGVARQWGWYENDKTDVEKVQTT